MGECLGDNFLLAMDFLRADRVSSEGGSAGVVSLLTAGVSGGLPWRGNNLLNLRWRLFGGPTLLAWFLGALNGYPEGLSCRFD